MSLISARHISAEARKTSVIHDISMEIPAGELVCLIGPNGAGKSSLMRCLAGLHAPSEGEILLKGKTLAGYGPSDRARLISYLPQTRPLAWPIRVSDAVALGRFAYGASTGRLNVADREAVEKAIKDCDLTGFENRRTDTLSGGELARVHLARAIASEAPLILADEPLAALDPKHQLRLMRLMKRFTSAGGSALLVLHDIALAAQFSDRLVWMRDGKIVEAGTPAKTLTRDTMRAVFDVCAQIDGWQVTILDA